ncbi:MAG: hypothetical protein FRX49_02980 [Trebouxia sp. A1-2]|nr:MAG: hypothetical protein FRX49_02980 [Trebouxia sp. A1-2]
MKIFVELDGSPAKLLSVSENVNVGEIRDALKASALEWSFDDGTFVKAADARQLSHLVADGLATSGRSASDAIKVQTIKQAPLPQTKRPAAGSDSVAAAKPSKLVTATSIDPHIAAVVSAAAPEGKQAFAAAGPVGALGPRQAPLAAAAATGVQSTNEAACKGCSKAVSGRTLTALGSHWHKDCWRCTACSAVLEGSFITGPENNLPYHPACYKEEFGARCVACNKVDTDISVEGKPMHRQCFRCTACSTVIDSSYRTEAGKQAHYHPHCYKEKFAPRCVVCNKVETDITVKGKPMHEKCFKCSSCNAVISGKFTTHEELQTHYHPDCYKEKFGARCSACNKLFSGKYTIVGGKSLHYECFKCNDCRQAIEGSHQTDEQTQSHHHPRCYSEKFGARCIVCNKVDTDITLEGRPMHRLCFKCSGCHKVIDGKYTSDDAKQAHYHPNCYKEKFGARCSACNKLFSGKYTVVGGKSLHYECFLCTDCHLPIGDGKYQTHGHDKQPYHQTCHRKNFDPRCDVCSELADGHLEYCVSSFWKQKYCKKHASDGTSRCCSCNRLKPDKQQWLELSLGRRMLCNDCSCTAVRSTSEAQPLYDNVLGFFAKMGLALRERPPMMLVDGDTLDQERKPCREADKQAPIFHTLGLCLKRGHGHVKHVVHSQPGLSSVYRQPSLNATLRPADLSQVEWEVKGILVMYGLPSLLTGAILAHEVMHAWVAENNINCGHAEGDKLSAVGEGIAELLGFMWLEAQASPVAAAPTQGSVNVPLPKSKAVDNRTWAQRVSADGRKYFLDPVTRQTTWHDPVAALQNLMPEWREHVNTEGKKFYHNSRTRESLWVLPDDVKQQVLWFEKLSSYYGNQTRTNTDKVYGEGFRAAYEAFQQYGLRNVLLHVKKNNFLPRVDDVVDSSGSKNRIKSALHSAK